jgi:hypothetical protein
LELSGQEMIAGVEECLGGDVQAMLDRPAQHHILL